MYKYALVWDKPINIDGFTAFRRKELAISNNKKELEKYKKKHDLKECYVIVR